jgi:hypothetical protein
MNHRRRLRRRPHRTVTDRPGSALKPAQLAQLHHEPQAARVWECDHGLRRLHDEPSGGFEGCTANRTFASKVARRLRRWHGSSACLLGRLRADLFSSLTGERCSPKRRNKNTPFAIISVAQSRSTFHCARARLRPSRHWHSARTEARPPGIYRRGFRDVEQLSRVTRHFHSTAEVRPVAHGSRTIPICRRIAWHSPRAISPHRPHFRRMSGCRNDERTGHAPPPAQTRPRTQIDRRSPFPLSHCLCLGVLCVLRGEISLCVGQCDQLPQPAIGHHDVVIEHDQVLAARGPQSLVDCGREHSTCGIGDFGDRHGRGVLLARQVRGRLIGRTIVDDDQLPGCRVCRLRAVLHRHRRVTSSGSQRGMMIDARPASELLGFTAMPHHRSGESGEKIVPSS